LQSGRRIKMATNNNGNLLDSAGNVAVDFVWGNLPLQPNDVRPDTATGRLDFALDNHVIAESGWNGYPLYTPNTDGEYVSGVAYIVVPQVLGLTTALALDALKDAGYVAANITQTTGVTNTATQPTQINVTTTTAATVTVSGGTTTWPVGTKVTIAAGTGIPTALVGTWTVTGGSGSTLVIAGSGWTVADTGAITPGTRLTGATLTVKTQTVAAGADSIALGTAITTTSWA
jgi:hypothetical protein